MNASKEEAKNATFYLEAVRPVGEERTEATEEAYRKLKEFLEACQSRLPSEAAIQRDKDRRSKKKSTEQMDTDS